MKHKYYCELYSTYTDKLLGQAVFVADTPHRMDIFRISFYEWGCSKPWKYYSKIEDLGESQLPESIYASWRDIDAWWNGKDKYADWSQEQRKEVLLYKLFLREREQHPETVVEQWAQIQPVKFSMPPSTVSLPTGELNIKVHQ